MWVDWLGGYNVCVGNVGCEIFFNDRGGCE